MTYSPLTQAAALDDPARMAALAGTGLLDGPPVPAFDRLTRLACRLLTAPSAELTLVGRDRPFVLSAQGLGAARRRALTTSLALSLAPHVVASGAPLVVDDVRAVPSLRSHPAPFASGFVAYLGVPVAAPGGHLIGALAVADPEPRPWRDEDVAWLDELAAIARSELELGSAATAQPLNGLANGRQFETALAGRLAEAELRGEPCAVITLTVTAPDSARTAAPFERLLAVAARRLLERVRPDDVLGRIQPATFALLGGKGIAGAASAMAARRLARTVAAPCLVDGVPYRLRSRVGLAVSTPASRASPVELIERALGSPGGEGENPTPNPQEG